MEKKLTLDEAWEECLKMWRWVVKEWEKDRDKSVRCLKQEYAEMTGISGMVVSDCYFCEYDCQQRLLLLEEDLSRYEDCLFCPGKVASPRFSCKTATYYYLLKPDKFLAKLLKLDKKQKKK